MPSCKKLEEQPNQLLFLTLSIFNISKLYFPALRTRSIPHSKELGQFYASEVFNVSAPVRFAPYL